MQEALAQVRQELGSQAAVLHTREVRSRGLARLWGGGDMVEVVASDNVSVPGRLPDRYPDACEQAAPRSAAGIDLTGMDSPCEKLAETPPVPRSRVANYLDQGLRPLSAPGESHHQPMPVNGGVPLLLVCGSKGAGATTISWRLAQALAGQGRRAVWVDGDLTAGACSAAPSSHDGSLADVLSGRRSVHEVLTRGPDGVQCVSRAQGERAIGLSGANVQQCVRQLKGLSPHAEIVIVDAGHEPNLLLAELWHAASAVCVVVTPADEAILRGYASIKTYRRRSNGVELVAVINRADDSTAENVFRRLSAACGQFLELDVVLAGSVPSSGEGMASRELEGVAERLWDLLGSNERRADSNTASTQNL